MRVEAAKTRNMGSLGRIAWLIKGHTENLFGQSLCKNPIWLIFSKHNSLTLSFVEMYTYFWNTDIQMVRENDHFDVVQIYSERQISGYDLKLAKITLNYKHMV